MKMTTRILHWNVFEDGLADTPASVGFTAEFSKRFSALLSVLSDSGGGTDFHGFARERDFSSLPEVVPINSTANFFGFIDLVYTLVYHCLGGEALLSNEELPLEYAVREALWSSSGSGVHGATAGFPIGGTLRSLFLQSSLANPAVPPSPSNLWRTDTFDEQLEQLTAHASPGSAPKRVAALRAIREMTFDPLGGTLTWQASVAQRVWKRETLTLQKWMGINGAGKQVTRGLRIFMAPPDGLSASAAAALARMCQVSDGASSADGRRLGRPIRALVEVELAGADDRADGSRAAGTLTRLRTPTFQSAVRWLLGELLAHARRNPALEAALAAFVGRPISPEEMAQLQRVAASAEEGGAGGAVEDALASGSGGGAVASGSGGGDGASEGASDGEGSLLDVIFGTLMREMAAWSAAAALEHRHALIGQHLAAAAADVVTLVEYDDAWRARPPPRVSGRPYARVHGRGTASVLYNAHVFEPASLAGVEVPRAVQSTDKAKDVAPKNSCVALLRRRTDGLLVLVLSVHLESGPPSDSAKVALRAAQVRSLLAECDRLARAIAASGRRALLVVGGDLNALREEFVYGNTPAFFDAPAVGAIRPPLKRAADAERLTLPPAPPIASLGPSGELRLHCPACDDGYLTEASARPSAPPDAHGSANGSAVLGAMVGAAHESAVARAAAGGTCTRAGSSMTIDFVLLGAVGSEVLRSAQPYRVVPEVDAIASADAADGIRHAVMHWGSDHLPVAADAELSTAPSAAADAAELTAALTTQWPQSVGTLVVSVAVGAALSWLAWRALRLDKLVSDKVRWWRLPVVER